MATIGWVTGRVLWDQGIPAAKGTVVTFLGTTIGVELGSDGRFLLGGPANQINTTALSFRSSVPNLLPLEGNPVSVVLLESPSAIDLGNIYPWSLGAVTGRLVLPPHAVLQPNSFDSYAVQAEGTSAASLVSSDGNYMLTRVAAGPRNLVVTNRLGNTQSISMLVQPGRLTVVDVLLPGLPGTVVFP
jgi:hypothetical protein